MFTQLLGVHQTVRSYFRTLGVVSTVGDLESLTPESRSDVSLACIPRSSFFVSFLAWSTIVVFIF